MKKFFESGLCEQCPRKINRRNWLTKFLKPGPDTKCPGPVDLTGTTTIDTDFRSRLLVVDIEKTVTCQKDVPPGRLQAGQEVDQLVFDRIEEALGEFALADEMNQS